MNATPVPTIVNVGGNGGSSGGEGNGSRGSITSSTTRSSNTSTRLPTADIQLMSPQSCHQQWGGYSLVGKEGVLMNLWRPDGKPSHVLEFQLDEYSNTPTAVNVSCTAEERETIGPYLWSSCARHSLAFNRHSLAFNTHDQSPVFECEHNFDMDASLFPSVAGPSNVDLTPGQKELLLRHWRLAISLSHIQELMVPHQAKDENGLLEVMPCMITPAFKTAATCPIPCCAACELAHAHRHPTGATKQLAVEEKAGILSANQYQVRDLVSMDQFVSGTPGRLFSGYGHEAQHNQFHGGTIFNYAASGAIWVEHQVSLGAGETICAKERFEEWLYELSCVEVARYNSDNGVFTAAEFQEDCKLKHQQQTFSGMDASEIVDQPPHAKILDIIWAFKIKRFPDGLIKGFKGRICA